MTAPHAAGPLRLGGVAWQRNEAGGWDRHMLRLYPDNSPYWSRTIRLEDDRLPFCLHCLSANVTLVGTTPASEVWQCHDCDLGEFELLTE